MHRNDDHEEHITGEIFVSKSGTVEIEVPFHPTGAGVNFPKVSHHHGCGHHEHNRCDVRIVHHGSKFFLKIHWSVHEPCPLTWFAVRSKHHKRKHRHDTNC